MEFRLLGELEVRAGGRVVEVGLPRQRAVLAVLAVDAGRPVPAAALVDRVWADKLVCYPAGASDEKSRCGERHEAAAPSPEDCWSDGSILHGVCSISVGGKIRTTDIQGPDSGNNLAASLATLRGSATIPLARNESGPVTRS